MSGEAIGDGLVAKSENLSPILKTDMKRREPTSTRCPLIFTCTPTHTQKKKQINVNFLYKNKNKYLIEVPALEERL